MNAVVKLGSYISRGVYNVSGPFHPFGGAVDIIVVQQPDGTFKSSPWYVRFGKFQGVLKTKEKIVTISVNGEEAGFQMYLNHKGEAFFLKEPENKEGERILSPPTSGDEMDAALGVPHLGRTNSSNHDGSLSNCVTPEAAKSGKLLNKTTFQSSRILGRMFGRGSTKENNLNPGFRRASSLERAEIAANLLEVKWSTSLSTVDVWSTGSPKKPIDGKLDPSLKCGSANEFVDDNLEGDDIRRELVEERPFGIPVNFGGEDDALFNYSTSERKEASGISSITDNVKFDVNLSENIVTKANFNEGVSSSIQLSASKDVLELCSIEIGSSAENTGGTSNLVNNDCVVANLSTEASEKCCRNLLVCDSDIKNGKEDAACCKTVESSISYDISLEKASKSAYMCSEEGKQLKQSSENLNQTSSVSYCQNTDLINIELSSGINAAHVNASIIDGFANAHISSDSNHSKNTGLQSSVPKLNSVDTVCRRVNQERERKILSFSSDCSGSNYKLGHPHIAEKLEKFEVEKPFLSDNVCTTEGSGVNDGPRTAETEVALSGAAEDDEVYSDGGSSGPKGSSLEVNDVITKDVPDTFKAEDCVSLAAKDGNDVDDDNEEPSKLPFEERRTCTVPMKIPQGITYTDNSHMYSRSLPALQSEIHDLENAHCQSVLGCSKSIRPEKSDSDLLKLGNSCTLSPKEESRKSCHTHLPYGALEQDVNVQASGSEKIFEMESIVTDENAKEDQHADASSTVPSGGNWRLWPFGFKRYEAVNIAQSSYESIHQEHSNTVSMRVKSLGNDNAIPKPKNLYKKVQWFIPSSEEVASLNLKEGPNIVTFSFSTPMLGRQQVDARIYLWKWNTQIVISDVDGTITRSDVLGQFMPLVGIDWSQTGVTHLFSAIRENGYQLLFLSARAISQSHLTRQFLFNLKQDGKALPDGPVVMSPDGLFPSFYREVIRRAPHEFKISCLETIKALFPPDCNPFYAGFGNRDTDEVSYIKVGIPMGKIFIINPRGEVAVNRRVDTKSYASLRALVNGMFPTMSYREQEDFNSWNYWKLPPPEIAI